MQTPAINNDSKIEVHYYRGGSEARGEVIVVLDEGRPSEKRHVLPYRLFRRGQSVAVAKITVAKAKVAMKGQSR